VERYQSGSAQLAGFSVIGLLLFWFRCSAVQSFGFHNVCCPNASWLMVLGLSFYPLEQAPNMVIYAMSKLGTATSGLI
jgi:apolipoprotein N-acyltransferase